MKVLLANKYFFHKGGAEKSFFNTARILKNHGHDVIYFSMIHPSNKACHYTKYFVSTNDYDKKGFYNAVRVSHKLLYSFEAKRKIHNLIKHTKPDIVHLNNIYHQISPSILHSIQKFNIPIVMTLRDYKIECASYLRLVNGSVCSACKNGRYYQCFLKKCVKNSRAKSLLNVFEMYLHHKIINIYNLVDKFISPSHSLKKGLHEMGFQREIVVLPNFVDTEKYLPKYTSSNKTIAYFGRLSKEKGLKTLIIAIGQLKEAFLNIIGEGPLELELKEFVKKEKINNICFKGFLSGEKLKKEIRSSLFTVLPSEVFENNPRSIIESFALGKPVVGSRIGGIPELIIHNFNGLTFEPKNIDDLKKKLKLLIDKPEKVTQFGKNARKSIELNNGAESHYKKLMSIYKSVLK